MCRPKGIAGAEVAVEFTTEGGNSISFKGDDTNLVDPITSVVGYQRIGNVTTGKTHRLVLVSSSKASFIGLDYCTLLHTAFDILFVAALYLHETDPTSSQVPTSRRLKVADSYVQDQSLINKLPAWMS